MQRGSKPHWATPFGPAFQCFLSRSKIEKLRAQRAEKKEQVISLCD